MHSSKNTNALLPLCCCDIHYNSCACRARKVKSQHFIKHHGTETQVQFLALLTWPHTCHCAPSDRTPVPIGWGEPIATLGTVEKGKISASGGTEQVSLRNRNINIACWSTNDVQWLWSLIERNHCCICCLMLCLLCTAVWRVETDLIVDWGEI